jgi:hypothetical protein
MAIYHGMKASLARLEHGWRQRIVIALSRVDRGSRRAIAFESACVVIWKKAACEARKRSISKRRPQAARNAAGAKARPPNCWRIAARLKSCPVTRPASMESLQQSETFACHESSNAIALAGQGCSQPTSANGCGIQSSETRSGPGMRKNGCSRVNLLLLDGEQALPYGPHLSISRLALQFHSGSAG